MASTKLTHLWYQYDRVEMLFHTEWDFTPDVPKAFGYFFVQALTGGGEKLELELAALLESWSERTPAAENHTGHLGHIRYTELFKPSTLLS